MLSMLSDYSGGIWDVFSLIKYTFFSMMAFKSFGKYSDGIGVSSDVS